MMKHYPIFGAIIWLAACDLQTEMVTDLVSGETTSTTSINGVDVKDIEAAGGSAAKRAELERYVTANYDRLLIDAEKGGGPVLSAAYDIAEVPLEERSALTQQLQADLATSSSTPSQVSNGLWLASELGLHAQRP